jgi:SAM-dependent methyltransferase
MVAFGRPKINRLKTAVLEEYTAGWEAMANHLEASATLADWLTIKGLEDNAEYCNVSGKLRYQVFDSTGYNRNKILETLRREFPQAQSVTEYGCGVGRNLLFLKQAMPQLEVYGYELCKPGVEIARAAARKFGLDVHYSQLDYVGGAESDYVFPATDVAFTLYSLEQIPAANRKAMENILRHANMGSIHIEPVPENYPMTFRGFVGRIDHWKTDYLRNFESNISTLKVAEIKREKIDSAHNPLMFPTLYVLHKN